MNKTFATALILSLAFLPLGGITTANAQQRQCSTQQCPDQTTPELPTAQICFYSGAEFSGTFFCESGNRAVAAVPSEWRSRIKSISVGDHSSVRVCSEETLGGDCRKFDKNVDELPKGLFNHVYSYDIRQVY